jgi:glyoxylase-like metal-dependent hydrolase (beta-lactamase superfamily II)
MVQELITINSGKIYDYLHHIDVRAYGKHRMLSVYLGEFDDGSILLDCGSSLDTKKILRYFKNNKIPLDSFRYLITSHHHFDHNGGMYLLYDKIKKYSPNVKILTNKMTMDLLNNYEEHLNRAKRTYGDLIGTMEPIENEAFKIIEPSRNFSSDVSKLDTIGTFHKNNHEIKLGLFHTPGHTPDHQCPFFIRDNVMEFIFWGEAVGTIYHASKLLTMPTSMPTYFNYDEFMKTLINLKKLNPLKAGFGHFGVINGKENVREILIEHEMFLKKFREEIILAYQEKPETKHVLEKLSPLLTPRTDLKFEGNSIFNGIALGIVYGMMMDLGYRKS